MNALEELDGMSLNDRAIEIKRSLKKGFFPIDNTNFMTKSRFNGSKIKSTPNCS